MSVPTVSLNEASPAGGAFVRDGDNRIREYKTQNRQILEVDHDYPSSGNSATAGQHKQLTLQEKADIGTGATGIPILGAQTADGKPELVYTDEDDDDVQITKDGKLNVLALAGVYPAADVAAMATMLNLIYPIGIVITLGVSTNPATLLGIGTWTAIAGKVIVGIDGTQTEFDVLNETGGEKTHTLITAEMPAHTHTSRLRNGGGEETTYPSGSYNTTDARTSSPSDSTGGGGAHNNLQPYIVKYVWQRTA